ncbi:HNH endonuclease [Bradyrhizobium sp.]|uniref:HNH endonuclease n=1 Tax=Bradyrhizobium sp. TaxID=376 RepID=UPI003C661422
MDGALSQTSGAVRSIDHAAPRRVYLDNHGEIFCLVSAEDYAWATQWRWKWRWDKRKKKRYAQRNTTINGVRVTLFLHKEILARTGKIRPSLFHTIGDHGDGDSLNNQRDNLAWVTPSQNRKTAKR